VDAERDVVADRFRLLQFAHGPERAGVFLGRGLQHGARGGLFDQVAIAQNHDAVSHLGHNGEVMGNVDRRGVELLDDIAHGGKNFHLGGHVESGGGLIKDDQVGPAGHGHGGHGALKLAAGDLVGETVANGVGIGQLQALVKIAGIGLGLFARHDVVGHGRFDGLIYDMVRRIEGSGGTLRHIGNA